MAPGPWSADLATSTPHRTSSEVGLPGDDLAAAAVGAGCVGPLRVVNAAVDEDLHALFAVPGDRLGPAPVLFRSHAVADGPAKDTPGKKLNDHGQINLSLPRPDAGDAVRSPYRDQALDEKA